MRACLVLVGGWSALCAATAPAPAPQWVEIGRDARGHYFYDPAGVTRTGERVRATVRVVATGTTDRPRRMEAQLELDCRAQTSAVLVVRQLGEDDVPVRSWTIPPERVAREPLVAGDDHAMLYARVCPPGRKLPRPPEAPLSRD